MNIRITTFHPDYAAAFDTLNRAWLVRYDLLEPADEVALRDPVNEIIVPGGQIFVALQGEDVVGTCALVSEGDGIFELAKLAVADRAKGAGLGRQLVETALAYAKQHQAQRIVLLSNSQLATAIRLYETMGFHHATVPADQPYVSADVYMELDL